MLSIKHGGDYVVAWICIATATGAGSPLIIYDITADRSRRMYSEVYTTIFCAQRVTVRMVNDPKETGKATQEFLKVYVPAFFY